MLILALILLHSVSALRGPTIIEQPLAESAYRVTESTTEGKPESVKLRCLADPESQARYIWKKDGMDLDLSRHRIRFEEPGKGHLLIESPAMEDEGVYQCFASNEMGTAVSVKSKLRRAFFNVFPPKSETAVKRPKVGESLIIKCSPPDSFPKGIPYWGTTSAGSNELGSVHNNDRVLLDYDGNLYFANIVASDANVSLDYVCILSVSKLGANVYGNNHKIILTSSEGGPQYRAPSLLWSSPQHDIAIKGQNKKMKCIFGGFPTPRVSWRRIGGQSDRLRHTEAGNNTEIEILNVDETDGGEYECSAINAVSSSPVTLKITLVVQSQPFWNQNRPPTDVQVEDEGNAEFSCEANGTPRPTISWGINGVSLKNMKPDSRRTLDGNILRFRNVNKTDSLVVQCVAENEHGSILANAHLTVISEPPSFTTTPHNKTVVVGNDVTFRCRAYGAPPPRMTWQRGNPARDLIGGKYNVNANGDLEISDVTLEDEDDYFCVARNKIDESKAKATLAVRKPTIITQSPTIISANRTDDVILPCDVKTDERERSNLAVEWKRNGNPVDYAAQSHLEMDRDTFSLKIRNSMVQDTAKYTCHAANGLDSAESSPTNLVVKDRPEPPTDLQVDACTSKEAEVSFLPGSDNNEPITSYTVYYSIDDSPEMTKGPVIDTNSVISQDKRMAVKMAVKPWRRYTFRVAATNGHGTSELSSATPHECTTPEIAPETNPKNVCSKLKGTGQLVITWDAVPREEHCGRGYQYIVGYKPRYASGAFQTVTIPVNYDQPSITETVIHDLPVFTKYIITVWSENNMGPSPFSSREKKAAYSSEGKPLITPRNFRLNGDKFNGTYGEFIWDPVDSSSGNIKGFFRGYRIKFWKTTDPNNFRTEDIIVDNQNVDFCPKVDEYVPSPEHRRRRQVGFGEVFGATHKLWPYSTITAGVSVLNTGYNGELSNTIEFETPEGPPEAVKDLIVTEFGSSHITVAWSLPAASTGVILAFILQYQVAPPEVGRIREEVLNDPTDLSHKILDLQAQTTYRVTLYAVTAAGRGEAIYVDQLTLADSNPDQPHINRIEAGVDSANVSFVPVARPPKRNPGSKFYVEYAEEGSGKPWNRTDADPQNPENFVQVKDLKPGVYFFRAVAVNGRDGHNLETRSEVVRVVIGEPRVTNSREYQVEQPSKEGLIQHAGASSNWFIVLMCLILLLLIMMFIICYVRHSRGDVYPVSEKEKTLGRDPFATEDAPFGEYKNSGRPDQTGSRGSLDSEDKPMESDTDSLGEYEDQDTSKFNEDGSFIGLYGDRDRPPKPQASMNTFV